jgi:DNA-binding NtrC family response regulator
VGDALVRMAWLTEPFQAATPEGPFVGSRSAATLRRLISLIGPTPMPVLILGETGTGKEVVARLLHQASGRSGPFIAVNCAALPASLVESELFGHVRGAFTGASQARKGLFAAAAGGTLFLDEVGELPSAAQATLLRVLEEGLVRPVGSDAVRKVDVRVLSATNRDLHAAAVEKTFRSDLLARLAGMELTTPPLRSRPEDLAALIAYLRARAQQPPVLVAPDALEALALHPWPRNLRELDNLLRQLTLRLPDEARTSRLELEHLPPPIREALDEARGARQIRALSSTGDLRTELELALSLHQGNVRQASLALGLARSHVYRLLNRWKIEPARFRPATDGTSVADSEKPR